MALDDVLPWEGQNAPGACKLQVIPVQHVVYVPTEVQSHVSTAITVSGGQWITINGTRWTQEFEEVWDKRSGALIARATVAMQIAKDELPKLDQFWDLSRQRFLALNHDRNGTMKLMGTREEPAMINVQRLGHGAKYGDPNAYELRVTVSRRTKCPFYLAEPPEVDAPVVCPDLAYLISVSTGAEVWGLMDPDQQAAALASADGAALWAALSPTQQTDAVNSVSGSVLFALLTTLHQIQAVNSLSMASLWSMLNGPNQDALLTAAGVLSFSGIQDTGPAYTNSLVDP